MPAWQGCTSGIRSMRSGPWYPAPILLHTAKLLPSKTKEEKEADRLAAKMDMILRVNPEKVRGRQMLMGAMVAICSGRKADRGIQPMMHRCKSSPGAV